MAERSLQVHVFLDQRVDVDRHDVGRPADLGDLAARARQGQRRRERPARAGGIADQVGAERIEAAHDFIQVVAVDVDGLRRAEPGRRFEPRRVGGAAGDNQRIGSG